MSTVGDLSPENTIQGGTDGSLIGNTGDALKVTSTFTNENKDVLGNLVALPMESIWETNNRFSTRSDYWSDFTANGGAITHSAGTASAILSVGTAINSEAARQTYQCFHYTKGNAVRVILTGSFSGMKSGVRKRYGQFNKYNGVFFEADGTNMYVVERSDASGSIVDTKTISANWNGDKLDGTGASGIVIDPTKMHSMWIEYAWLGVGVIRYGIYAGTKAIVIHESVHSNAISAPWARTAELPIRAEIKNTTSQASGSELSVTCVSVKSIGSHSSIGSVKTVSTGVTAVSISTTPKIVAGVRLNTTSFRGAGLVPIGFNITAASGTSIAYYQVILRPILTSPTWSAYTNIADVITNKPSFTGGIVLDSGYINLGSNGNGNSNIGGGLSSALETDKWLGYDINDVGDSLILVIQTISGSGSVLFTGSWSEQT